ncbi:MAG: hypothetical protein KGH98_01615 [Candidatus Micrarchaeota archaeon]|nr:hypothetical protein [Candidatus Micrarchaeota archaeon]
MQDNTKQKSRWAQANDVLNLYKNVRDLRLEYDRRNALMRLIDDSKGGTGKYSPSTSIGKEIYNFLLRKGEYTNWSDARHRSNIDFRDKVDWYLNELLKIDREGKLGHSPNQAFDTREKAYDEIIDDFHKLRRRHEREINLYGRMGQVTERIMETKRKIAFGIVNGATIGVALPILIFGNPENAAAIQSNHINWLEFPILGVGVGYAMSVAYDGVSKIIDLIFDGKINRNRN